MNTETVGQDDVDQEIRASKGTAGDDFGLIFAVVGRRGVVGRRCACMILK